MLKNLSQKLTKRTQSKLKAYSTKTHHTAPTFASFVSSSVSLGTIVLQSCLVGVPLFACGAVKVASQKTNRLASMGKKADDTIIKIADNWIGVNNWLIDHLLPNQDWRIRLPDNLATDKRYLLICNHQSWVDTSIIQYVSAGKLPLTRFFAKHELLYIPIVGQAFYLLDFPMMKRPSKAKLAKNPSLAGRDLAEASRACQLLANKPFVLLNYLEGTRFSDEKHAKQQSPYRHLLKPKAGGFALALSSLGNQIDGILDMTVVYPDGVPDYGELWAGKIKRLGVEIREVAIDEPLLSALKNGDYQTNNATKDALHLWLDRLWQQKDQKIEQMLSEFA